MYKRYENGDEFLCRKIICISGDNGEDVWVMRFDWIELVGVIATLCVLISFTQSKTNRIRIINSIGSVVFIIYGLLINSFSVWFLNAAVLCVNIYKLIRYNKEN